MKNAYGLLGKSLSHSFSKSFFNEKFQKEQINAIYSNYELSDLSNLRSTIEKHSLKGMNVTVPYKELVLNFVDELEYTCEMVGSTNTLVPSYVNNKLVSIKAHNTDTFGFHQSIKPFLKSHHEKALILGTGGAAKAIAYVLKTLNIDVNFISRKIDTHSKNIFHWNDLNEHMVFHHKFIINTTPVGMYPHQDETFSFPYHALTNKHFVYDLIYNPKQTIFLRKSMEKKAFIKNGYDMLIHQAEKAWEIWNLSND